MKTCKICGREAREVVAGIGLCVKHIPMDIPYYMWDGLISYIYHRQAQGNFLTSIFSNNLKSACYYADNENKHYIWHYVYYLYNYAPIDCWGSEEKVKEWLNGRKKDAS